MRFVCESCRAQYMINDEKVGPKGVKVRCRKCGYVIHVKKTDGAAAKNGPVNASNDPDDATATQVMNSPLAAGTDATLDLTSPGAPAADPPTSRVNMNDPAVQAAMESKAAKTAAAKEKNGAEKNGEAKETPKNEAKPGDSFLGADEDEIGAVFDSVLAGGSTGPTMLPAGGLEAKGAVEGDRESTKVLDADMVKKLAEESNSSGSSNPGLAKVEEVPQQDWYVALNDKQTGPMPLDQLKQHWDKGEVGPDSLCWRAGFSDWIPVSQVKILASVLAPKPAKPIVVAAAATMTPGIIAPAPSVVSVPVQSAFSAGGLVTTVQSEVQVPIAAAALPSNIAAQEDTGTWRPSAASALASLVKEEMEVLAKPPPKKPEPSNDLTAGGLLDLPAAEEKPAASAHHAPEPVAARPPPPAPPPVNPYMANQGATYSAPAVTQYRPPSNRGLLIGLGVGGGVLLLCLIGLVLFLALREPKVVVAQPTVPTQPAQPTQPPPANPPVAAVQPPPAQPTQPPPAQPPPAQPANPPVAEAQPAPVAQPAQPAVAVKANTGGTKTGGTRVAAAKAEKEPPARVEPPVKESPKASSSGDESFDDLFGDGKKKPAKEEPKGDAAPAKKKEVYIPAAPGSGGGDLKDALESSDIMETVVANKSGLQRCAEEQKKREGGSSGKIVMKWTIETSGAVKNVSVVTEELKGSYMASCMSTLIKGMKFPRHKKQGEPVQFPFKF